MRYELNDYEWSVIKPMLPNKSRGVPRVDVIADPSGARPSTRLGDSPLEHDPTKLGQRPTENHCLRLTSAWESIRLASPDGGKPSGGLTFV